MVGLLRWVVGVFCLFVVEAFRLCFVKVAKVKFFELV